MVRKPNKEVLDEHDSKRQVELKLLVLRDALEERGYTEDEVEDRLQEARKAATAEEAGSGRGAGRPTLPGRRFTDTQSHHVAARKERQLETVRAAFGLVDIEDAKEEDGESDMESMEIVAGKYYEELDTTGQKDSKDSKVAKKSQKEKGMATSVYTEVQEGPTFEMTFIMGKRKTKEEEERDYNDKWFRPVILNRRRKAKEEEERENDEQVLSSF